jgi:hypothetical protein
MSASESDRLFADTRIRQQLYRARAVSSTSQAAKRGIVRALMERGDERELFRGGR